MESTDLYCQRLLETISLALNIDLPASRDINHSIIKKIRLLLQIIAESVPFKPNISKLSECIEISRPSLINYLRYLEELRIIKGLYADTKGIGILQKSENIYLHHPNLIFAQAGNNSNLGNIRESFFINQTAIISPVQYTKEVDFLMENNIFEIGGRKKHIKK